MDLVPTLISTGWASGVNAYATVLLLGLFGRAGVGEVPDQLMSTSVLLVAGAMFAVEFIVDKIPYLDNAWDSVHTVVRPAVGALLGLGFSSGDGSVDQLLAGAGSGSIALVSHGVKAGIRLGVNVSPEPLSNIALSLTEDGLVAGVVRLALGHPVIAAAIALILLAAGGALVITLAGRIRRGLRRLRGRRALRS